MNIKELALDVIDVIDLYNKNKVNLIHFPGEENTMSITRYVAYRIKIQLSDDEINTLNKYRSLDYLGKHTIAAVLEM